MSGLPTPPGARIDLYWLPLGAGGRSVRLNGMAFEAIAALLDGRDRRDLYHAALEICLPGGRFAIEQAPAWSGGDGRGVVASGAVGARRAGRLRLFRYEIRRWHDGVIPDLDEAVESPRRLTDDPALARRLLDLVPDVPTPVWGRDELGAGEMWTSNSTVSWLLTRLGLDVDSIPLPAGGRAPGWRAGIVVARRPQPPGGAFRTGSSGERSSEVGEYPLARRRHSSADRPGGAAPETGGRDLRRTPTPSEALVEPRSPSDPEPHAKAAAPVFDRILVGIDSTDESLVAAAQANLLRAPGGRLVLLAAVERHLAAQAGLFSATAEDHLVAGTSTELDRALELVDADDAVLLQGSLSRLLASETARRDATLVAVGVRPHGRLAAAAFGGPDVEALHVVPCSVLIARPGWGPAHPDRVVVGVDGSDASRTAELVARLLAKRLACEVVPVVPLGGSLDAGVLRSERDDGLLHPGTLPDGLVRASTDRSLIVVGRTHERDRRSARTADRVVHAARCSVLVVDHAAAGQEAGTDG